MQRERVQALDLNNPLVQLGCTILYNKLLEAFEPHFTYTHSGMVDFIQRSVSDMKYSLDASAHFLPADSDAGDLLIAFEAFIRGSEREYMLMGIGDARSERIDSASVAQGDNRSVGWPAAGFRELHRRIDTGAKCRMISIHNHPTGLLHELLRLIRLAPPGPSSTDRDEALRWLVQAFTTKTVLPEFYLVEDGKFRRIKYPSWESIAGVVRSIHALMVRR